MINHQEGNKDALYTLPAVIQFDKFVYTSGDSGSMLMRQQLNNTKKAKHILCNLITSTHLCNIQ